MPATNARAPTVRWIVRSLSSMPFVSRPVGSGMAITVGRSTDKSRRPLHPQPEVVAVAARYKLGSWDRLGHIKPPIGVRSKRRLAGAP